MNTANAHWQRRQILRQRYLRYLHSLSEVMKAAGAEKQLSDLHARLLKRLKTMSAQEFDEFLVDEMAMKPRTGWAGSVQTRRAYNSPHETDLNNLREQILRSERPPRKLLEEIAAEHFQIPASQLKQFSNAESLRTKVLSLIDNELIHKSIATLASTAPDREHK